jgi:hypothetical protein
MLVLSLKVIHYQISNVKNGSPVGQLVTPDVLTLFPFHAYTVLKGGTTPWPLRRIQKQARKGGETVDPTH